MRALVVVATLLAIAPAALAAGARERQAAGPISAVAAAGAELAYADQYRPGCHELRLWHVGVLSDRRIASHCFAGTSTGSGVAGVIATGGRALWLTYTGGNIREWSLWTRGRGAVPRRIAFLAADVDGPPPVVLGRVWEASLPYAVGRTIVVLAPNGSRRFTVSMPDRVVALSAHSRGYAAVLASGGVVTISLQGKIVREHAYPPRFVEEAVLAAPGLVVKTSRGLEIWGAVGSLRQIRLPQGSRFLGLSEGIVAYGTGRQLRLRRLNGGRDVLFRTLGPRFHAQLGRRGVVYGSGRTLGFTAWAVVSGSV